MSQSGLQSVSNASEIFLSEQYSDSDFLAGLAITVIMDGSRTFLIEIQVIFLCTIVIKRTLSCKAHYGFPYIFKNSLENRHRHHPPLSLIVEICKQL